MIDYLYLGVDPALVGLSMYYAIRLIGQLQFTIRTSAEVENLVRKSYYVVMIGCVGCYEYEAFAFQYRSCSICA